MRRLACRAHRAQGAGDRAIAILPAGCMSAVGFNFPQLAFGCNAMISTFAGTASPATGVAGMKRKGETDFTVVGFAGDGGTADIIQALSGAIDRNDDILYICYDNEAYMNTGIQQSSLTPYGASTTTSPVDRNGQATLTQKKDMFRIVSAMGRPMYDRERGVPGRLRDEGREGEPYPRNEVHPRARSMPDRVGKPGRRDGGPRARGGRLRSMAAGGMRGRRGDGQPRPAQEDGRVRLGRALPRCSGASST